MRRFPLIFCEIKMNQTHNTIGKNQPASWIPPLSQQLQISFSRHFWFDFLIAILDSFICFFEGINFGTTESCIHPSVSWISFSYFKVSETPVDEGLKIAIISQVNYYSSVMSLQSDSLQLQTSSSCLLYFGSCFLKLFRIDWLSCFMP